MTLFPMVFYCAWYFSMVLTHSHFMVFGPFWREWGYVTINAQLPCIYGGRNNNILDHFWWNFNCEGRNGGNNGEIMMYNYGSNHKELGEHFLVLRRRQIMAHTLVIRIMIQESG